MKVQRRHLWMALAVLVAAVAYNLWSAFGPTGRRPATVVRQQPLLPSEPAPEIGPQGRAIDPLSVPAPPAVDLSAEPLMRRDPFLFGDERRDLLRQAASAVQPDPVVRSILYSTGRKTALVDSRVVAVGDTVGGLRVVQIERDAVVFSSPAGDQRRIALLRPAVAGLTK